MGVDGFLGVRAILKAVDADGAWEENGGGVGLIVVCLLRAFDGGETARHFLVFLQILRDHECFPYITNTPCRAYCGTNDNGSRFHSC